MLLAPHCIKRNSTKFEETGNDDDLRQNLSEDYEEENQFLQAGEMLEQCQ